MKMHRFPFHGYKPPRGQDRTPLSRLHEGRFGRLFRKLDPAPAYGSSSEENLAALTALAEQMRDQPAAPDQPAGWGSPGAPADTGDNLEIASGYTYFGQFVDHDITFDPLSQLQAKNDPDALHDFRSPRFDLDSLYGSGPVDEPFQYDRERDKPTEQRSLATKFLLGSNRHGEEDLPRTLPLESQGVAVIGDPRNDENIVVAQLQLSFLKLHNRMVRELSANDGKTPEQRFSEVQQLVRWHYQWVVALDYLPLIVGKDAMTAVWPQWEAMASIPAPVDGETAPDFNLRWFKPKRNAYMPVEFSVAAYRLGHSMVRPAYHLNETVQNVPIFASGEPGEFGDLRGFRPLPQGWTIEWERFLKIGGSEPQPSRLIDTKISPALFDLPADGGSLPLRNLQRGQALELPSGQDVARLLGVAVRSGADLGAALDPTPLWFYILKEAELDAGGRHLGSVGATIVAEIILGLLALDPSSWINQQPSWRPTIAAAEGQLKLADLVVFAGG